MQITWELMIQGGVLSGFTIKAKTKGVEREKSPRKEGEIKASQPITTTRSPYTKYGIHETVVY